MCEDKINLKLHTNIVKWVKLIINRACVCVCILLWWCSESKCYSILWSICDQHMGYSGVEEKKSEIVMRHKKIKKRTRASPRRRQIKELLKLYVYSRWHEMQKFLSAPEDWLRFLDTLIQRNSIIIISRRSLITSWSFTKIK